MFKIYEFDGGTRVPVKDKYVITVPKGFLYSTDPSIIKEYRDLVIIEDKKGNSFEDSFSSSISFNSIFKEIDADFNTIMNSNVFDVASQMAFSKGSGGADIIKEEDDIFVAYKYDDETSNWTNRLIVFKALVIVDGMFSLYNIFFTGGRSKDIENRRKIVVDILSTITPISQLNEKIYCGSDVQKETNESTILIDIDAMLSSEQNIDETTVNEVDSREDCPFDGVKWEGILNDDGLWELTDCYNVSEKLYIPEGVQVVGQFISRDWNVKEVIMPDSVIAINGDVFSECKHLERVVFSNNIEHLPEYICSGCRNLKEVVFPNNLKSIGGDAFFDCKNLKEFIAPSSLTTIELNAFLNCCKITKVELNANLEMAEASSISFSGLKELVIPKSLKSSCFLDEYDTNTHIIMPHADCSDLDFETKYSFDVIIADGYLYSKYVKNISYPDETAKKLEEYILANPSWFFGKIVNEPKILDFFLDNKAFDLKTVKDFMFKKGVPQEIIDRLCVYAEQEFNFKKHINSMLDSEKEELQIKATYKFGNLKNGSLSVLKYSGFEKEIIIPSSFKGKQITIIKDFIDDNPIVEKIVFPRSLENFDCKMSAINKATNLRDIVLQGNVTDLPLGYIFNFPLLESMTLPESIKSFPSDSSITYKVFSNSYAENYCKTHNLKYQVITSSEKDELSGDYLQGESNTPEQADEKTQVKEDTSSTNMIKAECKNEFAQAEAKPKKKKGCYVATCVYGSYDCPQVWTLRRFRDDTLSKTWFGRLFICIYYSISPSFVKLFGKTEWFKKICKKYLDSKVKELNENGYENTPYKDLE